MKVKEIKAATKKDKALSKNAWYSNNVARPISFWITKPFSIFEPTTVCFFMVLVGLLSIPFFMNGSYWAIIIGAIILQIHYILDHVDGNVARTTGKMTLRGKYLDFIPNITVNPLVLFAIGFGAFRITGNLSYVLYGFSAAFFYVAREPARLFRYLMIYEKGMKKGKDEAGESLIGKLNRYSYVIFDYPGIMNLIFVFALFGVAHYLVVVYAFAFPLLFVARVAYEFYSWKKYDNSQKER